MTTKHLFIDGKRVTVSRVSSVKQVGLKHVYDLGVQTDHNYFANGFNVHNCSYHAALEFVESRYGQGSMFNLKDTFLVYKHRRVSVYPAGPDKRVLRGRTRIFGSCLVGDSLVSTDKGLVPIKDAVPGLNTHFGGKVSELVAAACMGIKPIKQLTLENGVQIRGSFDHKVLTTKGLKELQHLTQEDRIVLELGGLWPSELQLDFQHTDTFGENSSYPSKMTFELAALLGYYVADGTYCNKDHSEFYFSSSIQSRLDDFHRCFTTTFNIRPRVVLSASSHGTDMDRYAVAYKGVKRFLQYAGLKPAHSNKKVVPWSVLQSNKDCTIAFLRALMDCDGGFCLSGSNEDRYAAKISYATVSLKLARQVQMLLFRLGIVCHVCRGGTAAAHNTVYSVVITRQKYFHLFMEIVGFKTYERLGYTPEVREKRGYREALLDDTTCVSKVWTIKNKSPKPVYNVTINSKEHMYVANLLSHKNCDELGWFPNDVSSLKNVKMNATEVYIALERSLLTVRSAARNVIRRGFYNVPFGYFINISSPSSVRDKIMELVRKAQNSTKILGLCKPTWEMNPQVPKSALAEEFKKDPVTAMRDYGAQPPLTNNAFVTNTEIITKNYLKKPNLLKLKYNTYKTANGNLELYGDVTDCRMLIKPCILALDGGEVNNSFAFTIGFLNKDRKPVIGLVGEVIPTKGMRLNYSLLYKHVLSPLFEYCNIVKTVADRWNSLKILADAEQDFASEKQQYSLKYADMQLFKSYLEDGQLRIPLCETPIEEILKYDQSQYPECFKGKPMEHFVLQILTVQDTGSSVIKGDQLTDDILRAAMLNLQQLLDPKNEELLSTPDKEMATNLVDITQMAVFRGYSTGGSSSSMGGGGQSSNLGCIRSGLK